MQISLLKYKFDTLNLHGRPSPANTNASFIWSFVAYVKCGQAFLFSLVNPSGLGPTKLWLLFGKEGNGIFCYSNFGPVFGGGWDLRISSNANTSYSSSKLGKTFERPSGQQSMFFTGTENFTITDYEVFGLQ